MQKSILSVAVLPCQDGWFSRMQSGALNLTFPVGVVSSSPPTQKSEAMTTNSILYSRRWSGVVGG